MKEFKGDPNCEGPMVLVTDNNNETVYRCANCEHEQRVDKRRVKYREPEYEI